MESRRVNTGIVCLKPVIYIYMYISDVLKYDLKQRLATSFDMVFFE